MGTEKKLGTLCVESCESQIMSRRLLIETLESILVDAFQLEAGRMRSRANEKPNKCETEQMRSRCRFDVYEVFMVSMNCKL